MMLLLGRSLVGMKINFNLLEHVLNIRLFVVDTQEVLGLIHAQTPVIDGSNPSLVTRMTNAF